MTQLSTYFSGKHVLITGGSSGIGLATVKRLAGLGAELTLRPRGTHELKGIPGSWELFALGEETA